MDYLIGAAAVLERGYRATIRAALLHARVDAALAASVRAALIDFDGTSPDKMWRLLAIVKGSNARTFSASVTARFLAKGDCSLADLFSILAEAADSSRVDLFAHWLPDDAICRALADGGIDLVCHPLEAIEAAAIVAGQRHSIWKGAAA